MDSYVWPSIFCNGVLSINNRDDYYSTVGSNRRGYSTKGSSLGKTRLESCPICRQWMLAWQIHNRLD
eukprot:1561616-Lingulodinium_polyedra.AAC.1